MKRIVSWIMLTLLLVSMFTLAFVVRLAGAAAVTVYINSDGSVSPPSAPISSLDNVTYTFTGNMSYPTYNGIVDSRNNTVIDGAGYAVVGMGPFGTGLNLTGISNVTIKNVNVQSFRVGILLAYSSNIKVSGNSATSNSVAGISLGSSSNNTVSGNNATSNTYGINLDSSSNNNIVSGNNASANNDGILLGCSYSIVSGNTVSANSAYGIYLSSSSYNSIHHNNFKNAVQTSVDPTSVGNAWDNGYPSGGNYWSNYNGTDLYRGAYQNVTGSDGIGDAHYVIDGNNTDHYPLMQPWTGPAPTSTYITLSVSLVSAGSAVNCTATVSGVNAGARATGTVTWSASSSTGNFSVRVCALSSGNCSTTYVDSCPGSETIAACYSGDLNYQPSIGSTTLTVTSNGTVYYSKNYTSVQAAINAATPGSNVIVAAGTYHEYLVVNKTLTILGEKDDPVFGGGGSGAFLTLSSGASGFIVTGIVITDYVEGIVVVGASGCKVYGNIMSSIGDNGIVLEGSGATGNVVYDNVFQDTPTPIDLTSSAGSNTIYTNIISSQATVTLTIGTNTNSVYENVISGNSILLNMTNSLGNTLYHNDFLVTVQITAADANTWDAGYPSGGNYWSDYQARYPGATQIDSSGIWNTAYVINGNNKDNYPLMKPYPLAVGNDIEVASVVTAKTIIGLGFTGNVTVCAFNKGEYTESFWVTAYATATGTTNPIVIGTRQVNNLGSVSPIAFTFTWNTNGFTRGNYTISAYAQPVQSETDMADNTFTGGLVKVTIPGDVNGNFKVTMDDIMLLINAFGSRTGQPKYNANLDITSAGRISMDDIMIAVNHFGQHYP